MAQNIASLTNPQKKELDRRLARLKRTGALGSSWSDVKKCLTLRRAGIRSGSHSRHN